MRAATALACLLLSCGTLPAQEKLAAPTLPSLISLHSQALGGSVKLAELTNFRFRGTIEQDGAKYPFNVWKRRPSQIRVEVETSQGRFVQANDGKRFWRQAPFLDDGKVSDLDFVSARLMRLESTFESPLLSLRERAARVTYLGEVPATPPLPYDNAACAALAVGSGLVAEIRKFGRKSTIHDRNSHRFAG